MTKRFIRFSLQLIPLLLLPMLANAETKPAVVLRDIHAAQLDLQTTVSAYHRYQGGEGDAKLLDLLKKRVDTLKGALNTAFQDLSDLKIDKELDKTKTDWGAAAKDLNSAMSALSHGGFADGQVINDYLLNSLKTTWDLGDAYKAVVTKTGFKVKPVVQLLRDQALLFEQMCALYIEQSYEQYGYTYRKQAGDTDTLDKMATRFGDNLVKLKTLLPTHGPEEAKLEDIRTKWAFLQQSFVKYTENNVPFLVVRFGADITGTLQDLIKMQDKA